MHVVTESDFLDRASEMLRSDDVRREVFLRLTEQVAAQRGAQGVTEESVLGEFAAERTRPNAAS